MKRRLFIYLCVMSFGGIIACGEDSENQSSSEENSQNPGGSESKEPEVIVQTEYVPSKTCAPHERLCDGVCTDITTAQNCGRCGHECGEDEKCDGTQCVEKCAGVYCGESCVDLATNSYHCGACGVACAPNMACRESQCECAEDYFDCDGNPINGCESYWGCGCVPGQIRTRWDGDEIYRNVGECRDEILECHQVGDLTLYELVSKIVLPTMATQCTDKDYNCNGVPDGEEDVDGDGFTICDGDCCDNEVQCKALNPELINPNMFEISDNETDDNCDGRVDEPEVTFADVTPIDYSYSSNDLDMTARAMAQAMGILWECAPDTSCAYGLVNASLTRASSTAPIDPRQVNIVSGMRNAQNIAKVLPREGGTLVMMSSGEAKDVNSGVSEADLELETITSEQQIGTETQRTSEFSRIPEVYSTSHEGKLQTHDACATSTVTPAIFDSVQFHLELKVPMNVKGIRFDFRFFSREYPEYVCSAFNDFFLAMLTSTHPDLANYPDRNIAFDKNGNPVSINNGFFTTCRQIACSTKADCPAFMDDCVDGFCSSGPDTCQDGDGAIQAYYPMPYNTVSGRGGGTAWLTTTAPVVGGETIALDFYIWDTQDRKYDSTVLIDNFKWLLDETKVNTGFAPDDPEQPIIN